MVPPSVALLHDLARRILPTMYVQDEGLFVFTQRRSGARVAPDGRSVRYSAIALIGLDAAGLELPLLRDAERQRIAETLTARSVGASLGDTALVAWATSARVGFHSGVWERLAALNPAGPGHPSVEIAWALAALVICRPRGFEALARDVAERLMAAWSDRSGLFPHVPGTTGLRSHVACFADQVYPIHALSIYAQERQDARALEIASRCARTICERQGSAGQWWWHYDVRTGAVIEGYPVYAIHQDAMAPMALLALRTAGGPRLETHVERGLAWLESAPELNGGSLVDAGFPMVWRKVARREPGKASRYIQSAFSRLHERLRFPGLDRLLPAGAIDYEDRPYHWGWMLYAWREGAGSIPRIACPP
ncbi:MAG: hypothetical protein ABJC89_09000 [Acidobacteriota bacterium]